MVDKDSTPEGKGARGRPPERRRWLKTLSTRDLEGYGKYSTLGIQFALVIGVFVAGGYALDRALGLLPWLTILGTFIGFAAALYLLYNAVFGKR